MDSKWTEVAALRFAGKRFEGHALDLVALEELPKFQKFVTELAKELWRKQHPDRARLPRNFEAQSRLSLRKISEGSAVAHLEIQEESQTQEEMFENRGSIVRQAVDLIYSTIDATQNNSRLPENLPKSIIGDLANWGTFDAEDEEIQVRVPDNPKSVRFDSTSKNRIRSFLSEPYEDSVDVLGEVFEADVRAGRFQIQLEDSSKVVVIFSHDQEQLITSALKDHATCRLQVIGKALFSTSGEIRKITHVDQMHLRRSEQMTLEPARSIWTELEEIAGEVPDEEWERLPKDLSSNLDDYIYGA